MDTNYQCEILERAAFQMTSSLNLAEVLTTITQGLVTELNAPLARIWLVKPGDICARCRNASICRNRKRCLHLFASNGISERLDGKFGRVPFDQLHIGRMARSRKPQVSSNISTSQGYCSGEWFAANRITTCAGYPLLFSNELVGIMAVFTRQELSSSIKKQLAGFATQAAIAIKNAQLFAEVEQLKNRLQAENAYMQEEIKLIHNFDQMVGKSANFRNTLKLAEQVAPTDTTVLIRGETGTGKELVARAIHHISSRKDRPLVKINCACLPAPLIEDELFGHDKGAWTGAETAKSGRFELADGGTIFLDEIGELPFDLQAKLLRVIEEGQFEHVGGLKTIGVDVRLIAATNRNLEEAIQDGRFREDLYYRLNVFPIVVPPLRNRREDIAHLVRHFVQKYETKLDKKIDAVPQRLITTLEAYRWPGNVRELENVIERAVILAQDNRIGIDEFFELHPKFKSASTRPTTLREVERTHILKVLEETAWVIEGHHGAALRMDVHPATLRSRMKKLNIRRPQ